MALNILFISYPSEDGIIADSISDAVKAMPENKLEAFLDRLYIKGGQHIPDKIQNALKRTSYFIAVGTDVARRNFDWCGLELGFYEGSHPAEARLETCLYHLTIPGLFAEKVCFKAESLKLEHRGEFGDPVVAPNGSEFFNFLNGVAELNALLHPPSNPSDYWFKVKSWAEQWAGQITDAFFNALQTRIKNTWYPQARLELVIKQGEFYKTDFPTIPEDAEITLSASFYNIFALAVPTPIKKLSWSSFIELVKESTGSDILAKIVSDIVVSALP